MSHKAKRYLMLLAALGVIAVVAGGSSGTFAGFNAEVANNNNYFATGTMFLHATKAGGTGACKSETNGSNSNIASLNGCDILFNFSNIAAGATGTVNLTLENAGSINAAAIKTALSTGGCVNGKSTITTTSGSVSTGAQTTIAVAALPYALVAGTDVTITDGTNSDVLTLAANAAASATSINVTGSSTTNSYTSGAKIQFTATFGTSNLCSNIQFYIAETDNSFVVTKCLFGQGAGTGSCSFGSTFVSNLPTYNTLQDLTSNLVANANGNTAALDAGHARYLKIGYQLPGSFTNANQNQSATFGLVWHIEQ